MDKNKEYAFPSKENGGNDDKGLTKREYFAAMAMQALITARYTNDKCDYVFCEIAKQENKQTNDVMAMMAYEQADAMLKNLGDKTKTEQGKDSSAD